ncbi:Smr/MutS family protein [Candidatus Pelagibacter sp.]|nr:Smr/MutS family protein [Candidatus Pelagibacter sp.]
MSNKISNKDKRDWEKFLSSKEKLVSKDPEDKIINYNKIRSIDLHGYSLEEANSKIKEFILKSFEEGVEKLKIITGKGIHSKNEGDPFVSKKLGTLKYSIPDFLGNDVELNNIIRSLSPAKIEDGGDGAFYLYLNKKK